MASLMERLKAASSMFAGKKSALPEKQKTDREKATMLGKGTARKAANAIMDRKQQQEDLLKELG